MEPRSTGRMAILRRTCALFALLPLYGLVRVAAAADPEPIAEAAEAEGHAGSPEVVRRALPVVVEAIRPSSLPEDPSSFTTVINANDFAGEQKRVEDLLAYSPGVKVRRFGGPGQPAEVSIRGSSSTQVVVLLDGVRLNTAQSGGVDLSTIPAHLVERIEVSRGGASAQLGSDGIGGVVNVITRRATAERTTQLDFAGGSFGTWQGGAAQTARLGGNELVVGYDFFKTAGDWEFQPLDFVVDGIPRPSTGETIERVNNRTENHSALVKLGRTLGDHWRLGVTDDFFYGSSGRPGLATGTSGLAGQSLTGHQRRTRNLVDVSLEGASLFGGHSDVEVRLFHRFDRSRFKDPEPGATLAPVDSDNRNQALGGRASMDGSATLGISEHRATVGIEVREDWLESSGFGNHDRFTFGLFLQEDAKLWGEWLRLIPGLRLDRTQGYGSEWLPRFGLIVQPAKWLRFKGNVERSYRVPNFDELFLDEGPVVGDPNLRPEKALNADLGFELGFDALFFVDDLHASFAVFRNDIDNSIVFQLVSNNKVAATNLGEAIAKGIEVDGGFGLFGWVNFYANYTRLDTEILASGSPMPGRPDDEYLIRLDVGPADRLFKLVGEVRHTGRIPAREGGGASLPPRTVYDASLTFDLARLPGLASTFRAKRVLFSVDGTNLGDASVRDALFFPQPGRSLLFGVEGSW